MLFSRILSGPLHLFYNAADIPRDWARRARISNEEKQESESEQEGSQDTIAHVAAAQGAQAPKQTTCFIYDVNKLAL